MRLDRNIKQWFRITMAFQDGETWECQVEAADPEAALTRFLRRKIVARSLLTERCVAFTVEDVR